ncbi:hypothetical protein FRX31_010939 [Thalictrum thalictroides]|uniref:Uncharacterized protein n=1 Tax=Thalictrum thalictroides TaxID=46969 RepID=A0A7J6WR94_THATH|nr:hypothetical protein FRX31_010939 [Thalictrum thalictroides]
MKVYNELMNNSLKYRLAVKDVLGQFTVKRFVGLDKDRYNIQVRLNKMPFIHPCSSENRKAELVLLTGTVTEGGRILDYVTKNVVDDPIKDGLFDKSPLDARLNVFGFLSDERKKTLLPHLAEYFNPKGGEGTVVKELS